MAIINGRTVIDTLSGLDKKLLEFVSKKRNIRLHFNLMLETAAHLEFEGIQSLKNFIYTIVFTQRRQITEFIKAYSATLSPMELKVLEIIHRTPMEWVIFGIAKHRGRNDFIAYDQWWDDFRLFIFQESIWEVLEESPGATFAALVFKLDDEPYTFTPPYHFPTLDTNNLLPFFEIVDPKNYYKKGITAVIRNNYPNFFLLYHKYPEWVATNSSDLVHFFWGEFQVDSFDPDDLLGEWKENETVYGYNQYYYNGIESDEIQKINLSPEFYKEHGLTKKKFWSLATHRDLRIYWDEITERGYFRAHSLSGPDLIREVLEASFKLEGFTTLWGMPHTLFSWITTFGTPITPWSFIIDDIEAFNPDTYEDPFEEELFDDAFTENIGAYFKHLCDAYGGATQLDWEKLAQEYGVPKSVARILYKSLLVFSGEKNMTTPIPRSENTYRVNYPKPSVGARRLFKRYLDDEDSYFIVHEDSNVIALFNTYTNNSYDIPEDDPGLDTHFAQTFEDAFGDREGVFILNALFYILASSTDKTFCVRGLALELIHLYGHLFLKTLDMESVEFIDYFSRFTLSKLCSKALLEVVDKRPSANDIISGNYRVKTSQFFKKFIELPN